VSRDDADSSGEIARAIQAVLAGDANAFATVVEHFQTSLMTLCVAIVGDPRAAEELAEDVFVRAYQHLGSFDPRRPMMPWLAAIALRLARERWRGQARQRRREAAAAKRGVDRSEPSPPARLVAIERAEVLWRCVDALPLAQRSAVVLYYRENLSLDEVAAALGVSSGTVKTHLFRARAQIKKSLRASGFEEDDPS
jgi:RNA polymerase sigma-70 factor (ECF subfamily)